MRRRGGRRWWRWCHYWGKAEYHCWNITNNHHHLSLSSCSAKIKTQLYHVSIQEDKPRGQRREDSEDSEDVISERSLAGLAWTATGTISQAGPGQASATLRQTASSLQTSWSVTLFILGVLSFSFSLSVFQLSLWCISLPRWSGEGTQSLSLFLLTTRLQRSNSHQLSQWDRSQSWSQSRSKRSTKLGKN